ncbi:MAG TPA: TonB-dependent receptor, partial [Paludibacter sp.]
MKKTKLICLILLTTIGIGKAQNYTISGYITDEKSGETFISASVYDSNTKKGTVSNTYGFYSLTIPKGKVSMIYSYVGHAPQELNFSLNKDTVINIHLKESIELKEVTVTANRKELGVQGSQMSAIEVPISQLKTVPTLFGETDILKALQLLPGVKPGVEGAAGFYVRGGGPDENLFLLDGIPIYNVNHMGGFFSVFNADAIKSVTLYKGSFPARFGGRLSSVLDIQMNDGNNQKLHGNLTVGLISSIANLEGPLFDKNTTFSLSARRTYFDILTQPIINYAARQNGSGEKASAGYYFYDVNAKVTHKFSDTDRLFLSTFMGDDVIYSNIQSSNSNYSNGSNSSRLKLGWQWGNFVTALRWNHIINNKLFMNTTAAYTRYRFNMDIGTTDVEKTLVPTNSTTRSTNLGYRSGIEDYSAKVDFDYTPNPNHDIKFGCSYTYHTFRPGVTVTQFKFQNDTSKSQMDTVIGDKNIFSHETALYFEDNITINHFIKANAGMHYSAFFVQGKFYNSLQPRLGVRLLVNDKLSFKAGYAAMSQSIHLLSNNNISLPTDLWVPVTKRIKPMNSHQYSVGVFYNLLNLVDLSVESYYKSMNNLVEYKDGASFIGSSTGWEDKVCMGRGWAYGVEFLAQKSIGKTTGWIGYTWAKSERLFDRPGEVLNYGEVFPTKYDIRNYLSIVVSHKFNKKID